MQVIKDEYLENILESQKPQTEERKEFIEAVVELFMFASVFFAGGILL